MVKAKALQQDYYVSCLKRKLPVEHVEIDGRWLNILLAEYRLSSRVPNRKFKVPRVVLAERLRLFLVALFCIRMFILCKFGYDPVMRNIDQSPFHDNEAGEGCIVYTCAFSISLLLASADPNLVRRRGLAHDTARLDLHVQQRDGRGQHLRD